MAQRKIQKTIKLNLTGIKRTDRKEAIEDAKEALLTGVLDYVSSGTSPVSGHGKFKALSKEYKKIKAKISGSKKPNLELYGDMLDALEVVDKGNRLTIGVFNEEEAKKADGHNNFSGKSKLPLRRFIPTEKENFKQDIIRVIDEVLDEYRDEDAD